MPRRYRRLSAEERTLWEQVAATTHRPKRLPRHPAEPEAEVSAPAAPLRPAVASATETPPAPPPVRFRVGQSAPLAAAILGPAGQSHSPRGAAPPVGMDSKLHRRMSRGKLAPEARLDLHGLTLNLAQPVLERFVLRSHANGLRLVLVITGKGRSHDGDADPLPVRAGALRHHVPIWLRRPPLVRVVLQADPAHRRHGGEGAYYVYLRK